MLEASKFVSDLKELTGINTHYCNKYPGNIGLVAADGSRTFDCWNMIKSLLNGYDIHNNTPGYKAPTLSITGDVDGKTLLSKCTKQSKDFSKLSIYPAGTYLFIANNHAGIYVGDTVVGDKVYNVVECTASWGKKVLYSYVDSDGSRRPYKGGRKNGAWTDFGLLTQWVNYTDKDELNRTFKAATKPEVPPYFLRMGNRGTKVSNLQKCLNYLGFLGKDLKKLTVDGIFGPMTEFALKDFQRRCGLVRDGVYGPLTKNKMDIEIARR